MFALPMSRRQMLKTTSAGFGYMALAGLCSEASAAYENPLTPKPPHITPRAKRVIFLCMRGAPTHVDTFDYKPQLEKDDGKSRDGVGRGRKLLASPWKFVPSGKSKLPISELFPEISRHADDMCLINSMHTDVPNHPQAFLMLHTGEFRFARPSVGSWILYGLGSENQNLPGFVTIAPPANLGGAQNYSNGFLPASFQGTSIANARSTIGNIENKHLPADLQRKQLDLLQEMNQGLLARQKVDRDLEGVIDSFELAFRMQNSLPEVLDFGKESAKTLDMYGIGSGQTDNFGRQCLMARRLCEAGVRYVEICHENWDTHGNLRQRVSGNSRQIDRPIAGLLTDLKQRGLLQDTLVLWGGEFGRTPTAQGNDGRDHNAAGFTMWLAGGGVKGGIRYGATDEHGAVAVENKVHHHDLHATLLHLLGIDHQRLTYRYGGRDYSLTDIHGRVVKDIMA
ncbi:MAG: DUF1501 domain-containing protein [Gemmataceae bacterium]